VAFAAGDELRGLVTVMMLGCVVLAAAWVHVDAGTHARRGRPIVSSIAWIKLTTPTNWFFACLPLPELGLPVYVESRSTAWLAADSPSAPR
jgi:hypothetical protein